MGDESATPLAATLTWLLRHGAGMLGQILFTWVQASCTVNLSFNENIFKTFISRALTLTTTVKSGGCLQTS